MILKGNAVNDLHFLELAIERSKESANKGFFPAGSLVACKGEVVSSTVSSNYPKANHHAESDAVDLAMDKLEKQLENCTLYSSMELCLMCISRAYWAGIRRIVFAISKNVVNSEYFEGNFNNFKVAKNFHNKIELVHLKGLQDNALEVLKKWEEKGGFNQKR